MGVEAEDDTLNQHRTSGLVSLGCREGAGAARARAGGGGDTSVPAHAKLAAMS